MSKKIAGLKVHPLAAAFPLLDGDDFKLLVADIKEKGLREPITMYEGQILDGRNRARACKKADVKIRTRNWKGKDAVGYVVSLNLARRHLNESQRAMVAARLATLTPGRPSKEKAETSAISQRDAATALKVDRRSVQHARRVLEDAAPELRAAVEQGHVTVSAAAKIVDRPKRDQQRVAKEASSGTPASQVIRDLNRKDREKKMRRISRGNKDIETTKQYGLILADPSWMYRDGTVPPDRRIDNHYPPMKLEEICALPVQELALPDSVMALWIPAPLELEYGPAVLEAWGFDYKSQWIWLKKGKVKKDGKIGGYRGTGHWTIVEHELVLLCSRGDVPPPATKARFKSWFEAPVGKHSEKPLEVHKRLEKMYPKASKIELFCRDPRKGWDAWGNQADGDAAA